MITSIYIMENCKTRKEILSEDITALNHAIEAARKSRKSIVKLREQLVKLILELDSLGKDEELEKK